MGQPITAPRVRKPVTLAGGPGGRTIGGLKQTPVILDGLQDPLIAQALSARWVEEGFDNRIDVSGQSASLSFGPEPDSDVDPTALTETDADRAASIARQYGFEARTRAGKTFNANAAIADLRRQVTYEYKSRLATALVFGLPGIALHYAGPILAGSATNARAMAYPWLFELILVGWACVAAGWPILWQGGLSIVSLRPTGDLLSSAVILAAIVPSALGVLSLVVATDPLFIDATHGPAFHAAAFALILALTQRWLAHRSADRIAGRADHIPQHIGRLIAGWLLVCAAVWCLAGWWAAIALGILLPPMIGLAAVNPWTPGWSCALPVVAIAPLLVLGGRVLGETFDSVRIEAAACFGLVMIVVMHCGWRAVPARVSEAVSQ